MDKIIDIHNHLLHSVDDGSNSLKEALESIEYLKSKNINDIVLTTHYVYNTDFNASLEKRNNLYKELVEAVNGSVNLYLGNEVYVSDIDVLIGLIKENKISTLNNSKYLLIEFPMHNKIHHVDNLICELNSLGIIPIIAHPERYKYFSVEWVKELLEYNCLLQCNIGSFSYEYGRRAKKNLKLLLKNNLVHFLASDFHHITKKDYLEKALKKLEKKIGKDKLNELVYINPNKVLLNEEVK